MDGKHENNIEQRLAEESDELPDERVLAAGSLVTLIERLQSLTLEPYGPTFGDRLASLTLEIRTALRNIGQTFPMDDGPIVQVEGASGFTRYGQFKDGVGKVVEAFKRFVTLRSGIGDLAFIQSANGLPQFEPAIRSLKTFLILSEALATNLSYGEAAYRLQIRGDERSVDRDNPAKRSPPISEKKNESKPARNPRRPSVNERMIAKMTSDPDSIEWSAAKWGDHLEVTAAAVKQTSSWEKLMQVRKLQLADRSIR
jgi:hypothetical protein